MGSQHVNRIRFKEGYQNKLLNVAMVKLKLSQRQLSNRLNVSRRALRNWIAEKRLLPDSIFYKIVEISPEINKFSVFMTEKLPNNWGKIKGGKARGKMKSNLTNELRMKGFRNANKNTFKRKVIGPFNVRMYNNGEKFIAELLVKNKIRYKYEPLLNLGKNYAFPDFTVDNAIIERCGYSDWPVYWYRLLEKIHLYERYFKGKVILITPNKSLGIAIKRIGLNAKNIIILKESQLNALPSLIKGP